MAGSPITTVALDVGGVIFKGANLPKIRDLSERHGVDQAPMLRTARELRPQVDLGTVTEAQFWREVCLAGGIEPSPENLDLSPYLLMVPGANESLAKLAMRYALAILSNDSVDLSRARRSLLEVPIRTAIISAEHGVMKPDPAIYRILIDRLGTRGDRICFLDDLEENVIAARSCGMEAIRFESWPQALAALEIDSR